jgi:hypothetical protein
MLLWSWRVARSLLYTGQSSESSRTKTEMPINRTTAAMHRALQLERQRNAGSLKQTRLPGLVKELKEREDCSHYEGLMSR